VRAGRIIPLNAVEGFFDSGSSHALHGGGDQLLVVSPSGPYTVCGRSQPGVERLIEQASMPPW
jgi:hypothetical protein